MTDGQVLNCRGCGRPLAELMLNPTRPLPSPQYVRAACPYCGDASLPVECGHRHFLHGVVSFPDPAAPDEFVELTAVVSQTWSGDAVTYTIEDLSCRQS
jgi:hypothetical protein